MIRITSALVLLLLGTIAIIVQGQDRVLFKDVTALIFRAGAMTTSRRSAPIPQLQCQGKPCKVVQPQAVQCIKTGWDGRDATWRCDADGLPAHVKFGRVVVSCEGYSYPDDLYILVGSCGLRYQLVDARHSPDTDDNDFSLARLIFGVIVGTIIVAFLVSKCCASGRFSSRGNGDDSPQPPPYDDYYRMPRSSPFSAGPHTSSCRPESAIPTSASSGPGFFAGLGLGGLAGYAFGNRYRRNHMSTGGAAHDNPSSSSNHRGWGWGPSSWGGSSSTSPPRAAAPSQTRTAVGFATTERR